MLLKYLPGVKSGLQGVESGNLLGNIMNNISIL
jgi:hypothetical protein